MNDATISDAALAELLTLTMTVDGWGAIRYHNHLGQLHRVLGPAVIHDDGDAWWYSNGMRHRTDGPAVICTNGDCEWYQNDLLHRTDGPALTWPDGDKYWYLNGRKLTEEEWNERIRSM